jgi:DNA invertase Pin-like site-specific DNA recombinase
VKAYAYLRVSGRGQVEGDGFPRQREAIERYAAAHGIEMAGEFAEEGVSGTVDGPDRPAWVAMSAAMLESGVQTVVVEKLDRLARQQGLQEYMLYDMRKRGITVLSTCEDDLEETDPTRVLFRQLMGAIAQYDKSMIVLKLRGARRRVKAATGRCEGQKPFGHYSGEQPTLNRILALRRGGMSARKIASTLNDIGISNRKGTKWHPYVVAQVLRANGAVV